MHFFGVLSDGAVVSVERSELAMCCLRVRLRTRLNYDQQAVRGSSVARLSEKRFLWLFKRANYPRASCGFLKYLP